MFLSSPSKMRYLAIYISALASLYPSHALRHGSAQLRDLVAFPKYEVQFLNDLPLMASDASRCRSQGIEQEDDFLGLRVVLTERRRLSDGTDVPSPVSHGIQFAELTEKDRLDLIPMSLTPPGSTYTHEYLCLLPSDNTTASQVQSEAVEEHDVLDPVESWAALSHLDGRCLYSRQGWFTYS